MVCRSCNPGRPGVSIKTIQEKPDGLLITDIGRLYPVYVKEIVKETQIEDLQNIVLDSKTNELKLSIAGRRHSQGGGVWRIHRRGKAAIPDLP